MARRLWTMRRANDWGRRPLEGTTAVVTGATSGIGAEIAAALAAAGVKLCLPARNPAKAAAAVERLQAARPGVDVATPHLDLEDLASVRAFADSLLHRGEKLDTLILNVGIMELARRTWRGTADGFEAHFQVNFLAHAVLVLRLLPLLRASRTRIVVQTSLDAARASVDWDDLQSQNPYGAFRAYGASKLELSLFCQELAGRSAVNRWGITVAQSHPGVVPGSSIAGPIRALVPRPLLRWAERRVGNPPRTAAQTAVAAASTTLPHAVGMPDAVFPVMFAPSRFGGVAGPPIVRVPFESCLDPRQSARIWGLAERLAGSS